ncbi:MAG: hypothetical protein LAN71_12945 [Acidobacteriia bacterium]|nr:hypothetical protein [Terriglobia bacterium]
MLSARNFSLACFFLLLTALCFSPAPALAADSPRLPKVVASATEGMIILPSGAVIVFAKSNDYGELGQGSIGKPPSAELGIPLPGVTGAVDGAVGGGSFLLLLADGTVMAWGKNNTEQLALGINPKSGDDPSPVPHPTRVPFLAHVRQLAIADNGTFAFALLEDGTVRAWGSAFNGQLGLGTSIPKTPDARGGTRVLKPQPIPGLAGVKSIAAGSDFALALLENGTIKAWGRNKYGEVGDEEISNSPVPVTVPGIDSAVAISAGDDYALALLRDGTVRVWGSGTNDSAYFAGARSPSIHKDSNYPWTAKPVAIPALRNVVAISAGATALALLADGTVRMWGYNGFGSMGLGNRTEYVPTLKTARVPPVAAISTGFNRSYFILRDGSVLVAGSQLIGEANLYLVPKPLLKKEPAQNP